MSSRIVTFLGTASQVPTRTRNHNALFLQWDDLGILFDPGEGTQRQMTLAGLSATQITHICVTHFHGDHCLGLAGVIQRLSLDRVGHPVEVVYPASGQVFFERLRHASSFYEVATLVPRPVQLAPGEEVEVCRAGPARLLARAQERFHMTAAGAAELAARAGVRRLGLTHFSQRYASLDGFRGEAEALHADVFCAGDLDRLEVPARCEGKAR